MDKTQTHSVLRDGTPLVFKVITNRVIEVNPVEPRFEELNDKGRIVALHFDNDYTIAPNDNVKVGTSSFRVQRIVRNTAKEKSGYHLLIHEKMTTTANFIVPFLGGTQWDIRFKRGFVNAFLGVEGCADYGQFMYLLYRPAQDDGFEKWNEMIKEHLMYADQSNPDAEHVLIQFRIPVAAREAVSLIMAGRYSKLSNRDKVTILNWHGINKTNIIGQILYQAQELRDKRELELECTLPDNVELKSMFNQEEETYTKNLMTC